MIVNCTNKVLSALRDLFIVLRLPYTIADFICKNFISFSVMQELCAFGFGCCLFLYAEVLGSVFNSFVVVD